MSGTKYILAFFTTIVLVACQKDEIIFDAGPNKDYELPLLLNLDGKDCVFDAQHGLLKYTIAEKALQNFRPHIRFQEYTKIVFENKELSNGKINDLGTLQLHKEYDVSFITEQAVKPLKLVFTSIPILQVVTIDEITNEPKILARLTLNYPERESNSDQYWAGIEHRGASTLRNKKKSFGIGLYADKSKDHPLPASFFKRIANQKWILDAMYSDESKLRNKVSFELWNSISRNPYHVGFHADYVEVFINNEAYGLYCLTGNYTPEFLDLNSRSVLYKGSDNSPETKFLKHPENSPNAAYWNKWEQIHPEPSEDIVWADFEALSRLIVRGNDSDFQEKIAQNLDLENVIDYYLFISICGATDNLGKNWFFLKKDQSYKFQILPWDLDGTWGRSSFGRKVSNEIIATNGLFNRLGKDDPDHYLAKLKERWMELRLSEFSLTNLTDLLGTTFDELASYNAVDLENEIWEMDVDLEAEKTYILDWLQTRIAFLDELFG